MDKAQNVRRRLSRKRAPKKWTQIIKPLRIRVDEEVDKDILRGYRTIPELENFAMLIPTGPYRPYRPLTRKNHHRKEKKRGGAFYEYRSFIYKYPNDGGDQEQNH